MFIAWAKPLTTDYKPEPAAPEMPPSEFPPEATLEERPAEAGGGERIQEGRIDLAQLRLRQAADLRGRDRVDRDRGGVAWR